MKYFLFFILMIIVSYVAYMAYYLGAFQPVDISQEIKGPYYIVYKNHMGPYHKIVAKIEEVEKWAAQNKIHCPQTFGEYFDDPKKVDEERLRSRGGCITDKIPIPVPDEYGTYVLPEKKYVTAIFKGSPGIGPMKVYPKVIHYFSEKNLTPSSTVIEIYDIHNRDSKTSMTTTYLFNIQQ